MLGVLQLLEHQVTFSYSVLVFLFCTPFLIKWLFSTPRKQNPPPSPPKLPIIGNLHQIGLHPHRSLASLAQRYGPLMLLHLGSAPAVVISSAEAAREITKTHDILFANRPEFRINRKLLYNLKDVSVAPYGEYWRQLKSIFVIQLLSNKMVRSFRAVREEETALMMKTIEESSSSSPLNLSEMCTSFTYDVVCLAAFGKKYNRGESGEKFKKLLREFVGLLGGIDVGDFIPWLAWVSRVSGRDSEVDRVAKEFDEFLEGVIKDHTADGLERESETRERKGGEGKDDFIDIMLKIQKDNLAGVSIDRDGIKALILDVFGGGTDTTSAILEWAMTELIRHPRVMEKLKGEVRETAKGKPVIDEDDLDKMPYLKAVLKETLRLHPPVPLPIPREAREDVKVMGYDIKAGTTVLINIWAIQMDPEWWEEPEEFKPERFLKSPVDFRGHDFQFLPFGSGRRGCPGISFAMASNDFLLANLVHKFDWVLPNGAKGEDLDMTECTGLTIHRKVPLMAIATPSN